MEIVPFPNKVFIKPDKTDLGAFEQVDSRVSESGVVAYVGEGISQGYPTPTGFSLYESSLKVGDKVYFKAWGCDSIEIDGQKYLVADADRQNLLCKIIP